MSTSSSPPPPAIKEAVIKVDSLGNVPHKLDSIDVDTSAGVQPPALPPRPPPRPRPCHDAGREAICLAHEANQGLQDSITSRVLSRSCWLRKYVFLCTVCGGLAILLGALFLTVYFMLRSYTSSLHYFETVPTYIPAASLIMTGLMVMSLAGRRNRYSYLMKVCGACCLCCAILCVVVTVTTTVFHMNRLQSLRECVFTQKTQTCTCYSVLLENTADRGDEGVRYIFNSTPDCEVIHGALYSCLRAMFGLSVIGILVCIFSCMLVYQLLSHEKKKMYWEQLELRCRYLSRQQRSGGHCSCCEECRYPPPPHPELFPWEMDDRYWTPRVGNLYSPTPGGHPTLTTHTRPRSGWNWRRLPWSRAANTTNTAAPETTTGCMSASSNLRHATASPDSQYGFSSRPPASPTPSPAPAPAPAPTPQLFTTETSQSFYMWGPPPPYSSPCRREPLRQRSPHSCHQGRMCRPRPAATEPGTAEGCTRSLDDDANKKVRLGKKFPGRTEHLPTLSSSSVDLGASGDYVNTAAVEGPCRGNTLPARKTKKTEGVCCAETGPSQACRSATAEDSEGYEGLQPCHVANHQCCHEEQRCQLQHGVCHAGSNIHHCHAPNGQHCRPQTCRRDDANVSPRIKYLSRLKGISNEAFDTHESNREPTESEVYFADVSSCCNVSVKNESVIYDEAVDPQQCRNSPVRPGLRGLHEANVHRPYSEEAVTEHRGYSRTQEPCSGRIPEEDTHLHRGYKRAQEHCSGRVPEEDIPLHRGYNRTQELCSGEVPEEDRGYDRTHDSCSRRVLEEDIPLHRGYNRTQEPCSGRVPEEDIHLHRGYNRTQEHCSGRVPEEDRGYNRNQEPCSGRLLEEDIPLHRGYNRTQEPCSGRVPEEDIPLHQGYNRNQEPCSGRLLEEDIPLHRGYNRTQEPCSGRVLEEDIPLHRGYNRVHELCSGRVPEEDIPLHRGYNRTQEPCSGRVPEEDVPLHRGYNRTQEHGHRVLEMSDTHLKEEDDREDLEQQNLLQSNCFSYQRFCASSPGFVLREDPSWPAEAMECSSASVTPTSPATPLFYTRLQDQPDNTDYLAPDAQYETIPPLKPAQRNGNELLAPELNGNANEKIKPATRFGSEVMRPTENGNEATRAAPRNGNEVVKAAPRNGCEALTQTENSNEVIKAAQNGNEGELRPSPARRRLNVSPTSQTVRELLQNFENANVNNVNVDHVNG